MLQKLRGHSGVVYEAAWNAKQGLLASCSDDQTVRVWCYDEKVRLHGIYNRKEHKSSFNYDSFQWIYSTLYNSVFGT